MALLEPGNGDVAATDLQFRLDLVQLIAQTALLVGADRAVDIATEKVPRDGLLGLVSLLQPVALYRSTRSASARPEDRCLPTSASGCWPPLRTAR